MSTSTRIDGNPAGCRDSAAGLITLEARIRGVGDALAECRTTAAGNWSGAAAEAFDAATRTRLAKVDTLATLVGGLGAGLSGMADSLEGLERQMERARGIATSAAIPVGAHWIADRGEFEMTSEQEIPHADALALVHATRLREAEVHQQWATSLGPLLALEWSRPLPTKVAKASGPERLLSKLGKVLPDVPDPKDMALWALTRPSQLPDLPLGLNYPNGINEAKSFSDALERQLDLDAAAGKDNLWASLGRAQLRFAATMGGGAFGALRCLPKTPLEIPRTMACQAAGEKSGEEFADRILEEIEGKR
ncbi:hypothetical protein [Nocardioides sp. AE5]|uniref:hypothetical protein n=1 Tax=Nocardioides sp. AE5 TaxID=2962573 RepID=UPI002880E127|nr:hypothetical protein [Nocardioides sp. AE5]MDT0203505.1 hypothetical protein [Nocardioides sp. AE5]